MVKLTERQREILTRILQGESLFWSRETGFAITTPEREHPWRVSDMSVWGLRQRGLVIGWGEHWVIAPEFVAELENQLLAKKKKAA